MSNYWEFDPDTLRAELKEMIQLAQAAALRGGVKIHPRVASIKKNAQPASTVME